jgi:radical SAM protein with 4Fe4S-binding SPASM domain
LENPSEGADLFGGGHACGPFESLTVTSDGKLARCYSRRDSVDMSVGLRKASRDLTAQDFEKMAPVCRNCPFAPQCRGGCRCESALIETPFGKMDYLADPTNIAGAEAFTSAQRVSPPSYAPAA